MLRVRWNKIYTGRLPLWQLFALGLLLGILVMNFGKSVLLDGTGLLDEDTLYHMKYMTVDGRALFAYVLGKRGSAVAVLVVLATTYLGLAAGRVAAGWYGFLLGNFLTAAVLRYGVKGFLFAFTSLFPQYLLYIPAFVFLLSWCEQVCKEICFSGNYGRHENEGGKKFWLEKALGLLAILTMFLFGCLLESYVNPLLMTALLKIF